MPDGFNAAAERRFTDAPVARLATVDPDGAPHLVPVVFAVTGTGPEAIIYTAVDGKPKTTVRLRRLSNIARNSRVSVLVDHYSEDWSQLWWVRADGTAIVHAADDADEDDDAALGRSLLRAKYPQYQAVSLDGPVIAIRVRRWTSWQAQR